MPPPLHPHPQQGPHPAAYTQITPFLWFNTEEAISLDTLWSKLTANGGQESQCGWLKDRYGLSWQIVPKRFLALMQDKDPKRTQRVVQAMF